MTEAIGLYPQATGGRWDMRGRGNEPGQACGCVSPVVCVEARPGKPDDLLSVDGADFASAGMSWRWMNRAANSIWMLLINGKQPIDAVVSA